MFSISDVRSARKEPLLRIIGLAFAVLLVGCINVDNICPHKPITQGVFGEILDSSGKLEQNVKVDIFSMLNGMKDMMFGSVQTSRGGYQFIANPSDYFVCAKTVCSTITVPTGLVELSATDDANAGLTWNAPVAVPPAQSIGPCKFGE
ncbi:MAG TPA: hypothetical protein VH374_18615 [Polyangia bacterium]|nr:hypothetical protein [Polyangia bacterium]